MNKLQVFSRVSFLLLFTTLAALLLVTGFQPLQGLQQPQQPSGQGLEISPPLIEVNVDPGQTVTLDIRLRNVTQESLITKASIEDFVAEGEDGKPKLLLDKNAEPSPFSFKPWIKPLPDMTLVSQEAKTTKVTMEVPKNASPGGHYGVVRFSALPSGLDESGVSLSASLGALVLVNVSGDVKNKASLAEFFVLQNNEKKSFLESGPVTFVERIKNEGNVHFKPTGTVRVTDMFGNEVKVLSVNEKGGNVLPSSIRRFEQPLGNAQLFGRYDAETNIQYRGQTLQGKLSFWVIPYKIIAVGLGVLILLIVVFRMVLKRYNRHIIEKANRSDNKT